MINIVEADENELQKETPSRVDEVLVQDSGTSYYFNDFLLSKIVTEVSVHGLDL